MKASKYNFIWDLENGNKLAFNSMSCGLAEVNDEFLEILENVEKIKYEELKGAKKELVDNMLLGNFIVHDYIDELKMLKFKHYQGKFGRNGLGLTIAPTLNCNFKCPYCYETLDTHIMNQEIRQAIVNFVRESAKTLKEIHITWYGGEPLLVKDIIYELSEEFIKISKENNCKYDAYIVTNGYLIDDEIIKNFKKYKVKGAQITLDGPPHIHNNRRILRTGKGTFDVILKNIKKLKDADMQVGLRINIDKENSKFIPELLDILKDNNLTNLDVSFGHITPYTEACSSISDSCLTTKEYADLNLEYQKLLHEKGFKAERYPYYPGIKANYCCADQINSFVIDPKGYMYKCWNNVGNKDMAVGNIKTIKSLTDEKMIMNHVNWLTSVPFEHEECLECKLLPVCMGGCPYNLKRLGKPNCEKWKYNLEEILKYTYIYKTRNEKNKEIKKRSEKQAI